MSSHALYKLGQNPLPTSDNCKDGVCNVRYTLSSTRVNIQYSTRNFMPLSLELGNISSQDMCYSNFICVKMKGNACNSFGIYITHRGTDGTLLKRDSVCKPHVLVSGSMKRGYTAEIHLWFLQSDPFFDASCFFWCTETGHLPIPEKSIQLGDPEVESSLVRQFNPSPFAPKNIPLALLQNVEWSRGLFRLTVHRSHSIYQQTR